MGGIDYELNGTGNASPEKKKILSLKHRRYMLYPRIISYVILVFVAAILLDPSPAQIILTHKRFRLSWNNIASIFFLFIAMFIMIFPLEKILNRKSYSDKQLK
jgi:hypothetical protein